MDKNILGPNLFDPKLTRSISNRAYAKLMIAIAEGLQLKGLTGKMDEKVDNTIGDEKPEILTSKAISKPAPRKSYRTFDNKQSSSVQIHHGTETNQMVALSNHFSGNLDELEERVRSMMEKSSNDYAPGRKADICKVCGKEGLGKNIKDHIEANHLEGIVISCNHCKKTFRYRNGLSKHMRKHHPQLLSREK